MEDEIINRDSNSRFGVMSEIDRRCFLKLCRLFAQVSYNLKHHKKERLLWK